MRERRRTKESSTADNGHGTNGHAKPLGVIEAGAVYSLDQFMQRTGYGKHAMRQCRRKGLILRRFANRVFVRGDDFLEFLAAQGDIVTAPPRVPPPPPDPLGD